MSSLKAPSSSRDRKPLHERRASYTADVEFARALDARIELASRHVKVPATRWRRLLALSRLFARLREVHEQGWCLSGSYSVELRRPGATWATKHARLAYAGAANEAAAAIIDAARIDLDDGFGFEVRRSRWPAAAERTVGFRVDSLVAQQLFEQLVIDVSFGPELGVAAEQIDAPDLLDFTDIAPARIPVVTLEEHVADRVRGYAGGRKVLSRLGDRPQTLFEIAFVCGSFPLHADRLRRALARTFDRRCLQIPERLPPPPADWVSSYRLPSRWVGLDPQPAHWYAKASMALDPVLSGARGIGTWNPRTSTWAAPA